MLWTQRAIADLRLILRRERSAIPLLIHRLALRIFGGDLGVNLRLLCRALIHAVLRGGLDDSAQLRLPRAFQSEHGAAVFVQISALTQNLLPLRNPAGHPVGVATGNGHRALPERIGLLSGFGPQGRVRRCPERFTLRGPAQIVGDRDDGQQDQQRARMHKQPQQQLQRRRNQQAAKPAIPAADARAARRALDRSTDRPGWSGGPD